MLGLAAFAAIGGGTAFAVLGGSPTHKAGVKPLVSKEFGKEPLADQGEEADNEGNLISQRDQYFSDRRTAGSTPLDMSKAGALRAAAMIHAKKMGHRASALANTPTTFADAWSLIGPTGLNQPTRDSGRTIRVSGRIGALAIRQDGTRILGAAGGGIWVWDGTKWVPKTDNMPSMHIGALAVAPSDDNVVYAGTGEGALSGDSYFGNGVLKSTDGGNSWSHVSGDYFYGVSISRIVVDPSNANHLYLATLRGRGGNHRTSPVQHSRFGVWESTDGGATWSLLKQAPQGTNGTTDLELDPQNGDLYATFWGDGIYKSTNNGASWKKIMNGLPTDANYTLVPTRFSISLSHPAGQAQATLYAGFDWYSADGKTYNQSEVFKSTNGGSSWNQITQPDPSGTFNKENPSGYCATQCYYDNVVEADPTNPDTLFVAGVYDYSHGAGGIFRSTDGGQTWRNLGYDQHPDFHALAYDPSNTQHVMIGSDGGVWYSPDLGGRLNASDPLNAVDWQDLNRSLSTQTFTSISTNPTEPSWIWGGSQDNGTEHTFGTDLGSTPANSWFDLFSGDGGQVLVDPTDSNYVYGTYYGISPYRDSCVPAGWCFFSNQYIRNGINLNDRSEFYTPWVMNPDNTNQLFLGTYRMYRTDNAKAEASADVHWKPISGDLTTGCTGAAPNGGRGCTISAIGIGGGDAVYAGSEEGLVHVSPNAQTSDSPTWTDVTGNLPQRPVSSIAVDRSNYRIAYLGLAGFNAGTVGRPGHVFKTTNGGQKWTNISGNLPDTPVNSVVLDPSYPDTLYIATDVGNFVTYNGGSTWGQLGTGLPAVSVWQLNLDPSQPGVRTLAAGTYGRSAWELNDTLSVPAFAEITSESKPVGPGSTMEYTLTVKNIGNADATGVTITDPVPANTTFVSADQGGTLSGGTVTWHNLTAPAGGSAQVHLSVTVSNPLPAGTTTLVNDGVTVTSDQGVGATGSPLILGLSAPHAVSLAPATQSNGGVGPTDVDYHVTLTNGGFQDDTYDLASSGSSAGFTVSFLDSTCTTPANTVPVASGDSVDVCVRVHIDSGTTGKSVASVTATSEADSTVSASGTVTTIGVGPNDTLLVDEDGNAPDTQSYYTDALTAAGVPFEVWDLKSDGATLPQAFLMDFKSVVWYTGNSYPDPIGPYEPELENFLDAGGHLLMSGQDILDQAAGQASFFSDYVHLSWDGTETQNDKKTNTVTGVSGNPVTNGIGSIPLDHTILGATFEDEITPVNGASAAFMDDGTATGTAAPDALTYDNGAGSYKIVFLAFPFEAYGTASDKSDLIQRTYSFFGS
ncbi:MAG TPA: hypothetical protein VFM43_07035 [Gaiellaceae bacterium]|nr:hypothetical protein [Gaiellaceae bacterium]